MAVGRVGGLTVIFLSQKDFSFPAGKRRVPGECLCLDFSHFHPGRKSYRTDRSHGSKTPSPSSSEQQKSLNCGEEAPISASAPQEDKVDPAPEN